MRKVLYTVFSAALVLGSGLALAEEVAVPMEKGMHCPHMMEKMDADKDGIITEAEHATFASERFKAMDADGDGKVTAEEMQKQHHEKMMHGLPHAPQETTPKE